MGLLGGAWTHLNARINGKLGRESFEDWARANEANFAAHVARTERAVRDARAAVERVDDKLDDLKDLLLERRTTDF